MIDQAWANAAIESCLARGIDHFFLAPGSRCTPLTLAVARRSDVTVMQHFDERGLAFAALGFGKATHIPGVFICTSGTAVANAYPAVIEASIEKVPLLLFTADRPDELRGSGANQTIEQRGIFAGFPELSFDMPVPGENESNILSDSLQRGLDAAAVGPVHFNWQFREPFTIDDNVRRTGWSRKEPAAVKPFPAEPFPAEPFPDKADTTDTNITVRGNALIALGGCNPLQAQHAGELAGYLNCPILSDVTSGLRTGSFELPSEFSLPQPDTILHLGDRIVTKTWHQWTASLDSKKVDFIHITPTGQTVNPNRLPVTQHHLSLVGIDSHVSGAPTADAFTKAWCDAAAARDAIIDQLLSETKTLSEPAVAWRISKICPPEHGIFVGNSTPIRDMDWFGSSNSDMARPLTANRGASGIDGLLATATGYAAGLKRPTTVLLGDLSALHDLNSLSLIANSKWPLVVVILNNHAGHIFDLLPIQKSPHFEQFFATPHAWEFQHAAKMFGIDYRQISQMEDFAKSYTAAVSAEQTVILEVMTDRKTNLEVRQQIRDAIRKCSGP